MAKAPRPGTTPTAVAEQTEDLVLRVILDGDLVEIDVREFSAAEGNALRKASGFSLRYHLDQLGEALEDGGDPDLDLLLGLVWLVQRRVNTQLKWRKVVNRTYGGIQLEFPDGDDEEPPALSAVEVDDGEGFTGSAAV